MSLENTSDIEGPSSIPSSKMPADGVVVGDRLTQNDDPQEKATGETTDAGQPEKHGLDFWLAIIAMASASFTSALDTTIITTALPQITQEIGGAEQYVWIANSFLLSATVFQPLYGQLSDIFGRRWPYMISMIFFVLGAGIGGGAHNVAMLIGGRTVQGIGSAGLSVLTDVIIADLVPLRERAKYFSIVLSTAAIGTIVGPLIGGALAQASWRWCFYINLPLGLPSLILMAFFLRLKNKEAPTWRHALARVDWLGNLIFVPALTALVFGLVSGGQMYPWSSFRVILPIVLGVVGWLCFHLYEASSICKNPGVPPRLFSNQTTVVAFTLTFLAGILLNWVCYFLAFYFQAIWSATPLLSGVYLLPLLVFLIPSGGIAGTMLSKTGNYKALHWSGFAAMSLGIGLFSILRSDSSPAEWVFFQIFVAIGLGFTMTSLLPAVNAGLEETDVASATAVFSFLRTFGFVWGVTIPSIIFNNQFDFHILEISNAQLRNVLSNGAAYSYAVSGAVTSLTGTDHDQVVRVYTEAIRIVWYIALAFALLGFLLVFIEKHIDLRTELDTEYGLDKRTRREDSEAKILSGEKTTN